MTFCKEQLQVLLSGQGDSALRPLYAPGVNSVVLSIARARVASVVESFSRQFGDRPGAVLFTGPGRMEIGGNHTDHQHGHVVCGSVDLDTLACAAPNGTRTVRVISEGYPTVEVDLDDLLSREAEQNTSAALVRGMAAKLTELGCSLSGFDAYAVSNVIAGVGLSSSASFEVLLGTVFNHFFCGGALDSIEIAKVGQYADNIYFGKPCGLMDQMGSSVGGAVAIDFDDPADPIVEQVDHDLSASGHAICIVDTGSGHANLTGDYAGIPREMGAVAARFGKRVLREMPEADFRVELSALRRPGGAPGHALLRRGPPRCPGGGSIETRRF